MANKGKPWLIEHDIFLAENADTPNDELAELLGRSALGIECRRAVLVVDLHKKNPDLSVDECIARFHSDPERTNRYLKKQEVQSDGTAPSSKRLRRSNISDEFSLIAAAAECIRSNEGDLLHSWANPEWVPVMIKHHSGFAAYAEAVVKVGQCVSDSVKSNLHCSGTQQESDLC